MSYSGDYSGSFDYSGSYSYTYSGQAAAVGPEELSPMPPPAMIAGPPMLRREAQTPSAAERTQVLKVSSLREAARVTNNLPLPLRGSVRIVAAQSSTRSTVLEGEALLDTDRSADLMGRAEHIALADSDKAQPVAHNLSEQNAADKYGFEYAGWGTVIDLNDIPPQERQTIVEKSGHKEEQLNQFLATSICGNDICSSCLYVVGIAAGVAGKWTPISLALVALALYGYRFVYAEVGSAMPLNGGTYTVMLNTSTKNMAALAACLSIPSYIATAVVSAGSGMAYLNYLVPQIPIFWATIALLGLFALINLFGIKDSANVAAIIFVAHLLTLVILIITCFVRLGQSSEQLTATWNTPIDENCETACGHPCIGSNPVLAIFKGYCLGMLGISGFESSANYIEQQKPGVFPKTLRNMWVLVAFLNPTLAFLAMSTLPLADMTNPDNAANLLIHMASNANVGSWLPILVGIDATLVLSGAVLTAYVGIIGLVKRLAMDRILPRFLLRENKIRHTNHYIIIGFFVVCAVLYAAVLGDIEVLGGVYTVAFLSVMILFAVGNMLLKYKRSRLTPASRASWITVVICGIAVFVGLIGNLIGCIHILEFFFIYFGTLVFIVGCMFLRVEILKVALFFLTSLNVRTSVLDQLKRWIVAANDQPIVYFTKQGDLPTLNRALLYAQDNELTQQFVVCHVYEHEATIPKRLLENVRILDEAFPKIRVDTLLVKGKFGPRIIDEISRRVDLSKNFMFITCPTSNTYSIAQLGGVRIISA